MRQSLLEHIPQQKSVSDGLVKTNHGLSRTNLINPLLASPMKNIAETSVKWPKRVAHADIVSQAMMPAIAFACVQTADQKDGGLQEIFGCTKEVKT